MLALAKRPACQALQLQHAAGRVTCVAGLRRGRAVAMRPASATSSQTEKQVFQLYPTCADTCILDVRDALEVCSLASTPEEKRACYAVFGLDAERVEKYYTTVMALEQVMSKSESEPELSTPLTVKVFTVAVNVAAAMVALIIAVLTVLSTLLADSLQRRAQQEPALRR